MSLFEAEGVVDEPLFGSWEKESNGRECKEKECNKQ
jgi:hypothetical protein